MRPLPWRQAERLIGGGAVPQLAFAEERYSDITAQAERVGAFQRDRGVIGLAAVGVVDPPIDPVRRTGRRQPEDDLQAADRTMAQRRIGIAVIDVRRAVGAERVFLPDDAAAEMLAAREDFDGPLAILGQPDAL